MTLFAAPATQTDSGDHTSDDDLMLGVRLQDQAAFAILVRRHEQRAALLAQRLLRNAIEAEDVVQDAFVRVWRGSSGFRPDQAPFAAWFHRIVVNLSIDRLRRRRIGLVSVDELADRPDTEPQADDRLIDWQTSQNVALALRALPPQQQAAIALFYYEDRPAADVAALMGLSLAATESLLARGRRSLKTRLREMLA